MTLEDVKAIVLRCDPNATHYYSGRDGDYTVWQEYSERYHASDDDFEKGYRFQIDRYTMQENDPMVTQIEQGLRGAMVAFSHRTMFDLDSLHIHHIFDCESR